MQRRLPLNVEPEKFPAFSERMISNRHNFNRVPIDHHSTMNLQPNRTTMTERVENIGTGQESTCHLTGNSWDEMSIIVVPE